MLNCYWIIYHKISIETLQEIKNVQVLEQTGLGSKVNLLPAQTYFVLSYYCPSDFLFNLKLLKFS